MTRIVDALMDNKSNPVGKNSICFSILIEILGDFNCKVRSFRWLSLNLWKKSHLVTIKMKAIREDKHHVNVKRQTQICTTWPSFIFTCRLLFIISTHKLEVSCNFLSIRIVLSFFFLLIFYFDKFSLESDVCHLPYMWSWNSYLNSSFQWCF